MLQRSRGLDARALTALADLEEQVVDADGGRLKLEWGTLRGRAADGVSDLLWWEGDRLAGFLGLYQFGGGNVELVGAVAPSDRRRGIGTALLDEAVPLAAARTDRPALLLVPRHSEAGARLARRHGGTLHHSEHALELGGAPADGPSDPRLTLRAATVADAPAVAALLEAGFGHPPGDVAGQLATHEEPTLLVERDGVPVGTLRASLDDGLGGVYGFVVDPRWQGRGIGRDVLRRVCLSLRDDGATRVGLEVESANDRALGLYTSLGFERVLTEDYWSVPLGADLLSQSSPSTGSTSGT